MAFAQNARLEMKQFQPTRESIAAAIGNPRIVAAVVAGAVNLANDIAARQPGNQWVLPWHVQVEHPGLLRYGKADFPAAATPVMSVCLYDAALELGYDHETARCLATEAARIGLERVHGATVASVDALRELNALGSSLAHNVICALKMGLFMEAEAAA